MIRVEPPIEPTASFEDYLEAHMQYTYKLKMKQLRKEGITPQDWSEEQQEASKGNY